MCSKSNGSVSRVQGTHLDRNNWKINNKLSGLVTQRLYLFLFIKWHILAKIPVLRNLTHMYLYLKPPPQKTMKNKNVDTFTEIFNMKGGQGPVGRFPNILPLLLGKASLTFSIFETFPKWNKFFQEAEMFICFQTPPFVDSECPPLKLSWKDINIFFRILSFTKKLSTFELSLNDHRFAWMWKRWPTKKIGVGHGGRHGGRQGDRHGGQKITKHRATWQGGRQ